MATIWALCNLKDKIGKQPKKCCLKINFKLLVNKNRIQELEAIREPTIKQNANLVIIKEKWDLAHF